MSGSKWMWRRAPWFFLAFLLALAACTGPPSAATSAAFRPPARGVHLLLDDGRHAWPEALWSPHLDAAAEIVGEGGWVIQLVRDDDLDPVRWQRLLDLCAARGLEPVIRLATRFDQAQGFWVPPPADSDGRYRGAARRYADFVAALRWSSEPRLIVGNEPNNGAEWGGRPDPAAYARFLVDVAAAIHERLPQARILNGGLDQYAPDTRGQPLAGGLAHQDATSFLQQMVAAEPAVLESIDYWASHPYPLGPFAAPPWEQTWQVDRIDGAPVVDDPERPANRGINGYGWELALLRALGAPDLPVVITETGWRHAQSSDPASTDNAPAGLPDDAQAAIYLELAWWGNDGRHPQLPQSGWVPWAADIRLIAVAPFALNGTPSSWGHTNWLQLDGDGRIVGRYLIADTWHAAGASPAAEVRP